MMKNSIPKINIGEFKNNYVHFTNKQLSIKYDVSISCIEKLANKLKLYKKNYSYKDIVEYYKEHTCKETAKYFNISVDTVNIARKNLGYNKITKYNNSEIINKKESAGYLYPYLLEIYSLKDNGVKTLFDFYPGSKYKATWICLKHGKYKQSINAKCFKNNNCPKCKCKKSKNEIRIYTELNSLFDNVDLGLKTGKYEIDVYIKDINLAIEYDGLNWHKNKYKKDLEKNSFLKKSGFQLLRIRENGLKKISKTDLICELNSSSLIDFSCIKNILNFILEKYRYNISELKIKNIEHYLKNGVFLNENEYLNNLYSLMNRPSEFNCFAIKFPEIAKEWHHTKNGNFTPFCFSYGSKYKCWWKCIKCNNQWQATILNRTNGSGCRNCDLINRNKSGCIGVKKTRNGTWASTISINGDRISIGIYRKKSNAIKSRKEAEKMLYSGVTNKNNYIYIKKKYLELEGNFQNGVSYNKSKNKWTSKISINKKSIYLGCFKDKRDAIKIRKIAEKMKSNKIVEINNYKQLRQHLFLT